MATEQSSSWVYNEYFLRELSRRLTWGDDPAWDRQMFADLAKASGEPSWKISHAVISYTVRQQQYGSLNVVCGKKEPLESEARQCANKARGHRAPAIVACAQRIHSSTRWCGHIAAAPVAFTRRSDARFVAAD